MPTYLELNREEWYRDQFEPPALDAYNTRLRAFYGHTRAQTGSPGDNNHLKGRHRSINWCLNSAYCTNRAYGTTDPRDRRGNWDWYRATDTGITGQTLFAACKRLDEAVRAGRLLGLAEWYGTFDGVNVVGWFQGKPSNDASTSHLSHLHTGYWTEHADDHELFDLLFEVITGGEDMAIDQDDFNALIYRVEGLVALRDPINIHVKGPDGKDRLESNLLAQELTDIRNAIAELEAGGGTGLSEDQIRAIVREELDKTKLAG